MKPSIIELQKKFRMLRSKERCHPLHDTSQRLLMLARSSPFMLEHRLAVLDDGTERHPVGFTVMTCNPRAICHGYQPVEEFETRDDGAVYMIRRAGLGLVTCRQGYVFWCGLSERREMTSLARVLERATLLVVASLASLCFCRAKLASSSWTAYRPEV
jgi:hypothetical protein